jgi:hypothetical protein
MGNTRENRFTVHQRLASSEARLTALEAENKQLRQWVLGELTSKINDAKNTIEDSIRVPQDGKDGLPGRDGVDGQTIVGPKGDTGDVLIIPESAMAKAVLDLRRELKEKHAATIAVIVERLEYEKSAGIEGNGAWLHRHFAQILESLMKDIERLR